MRDSSWWSGKGVGGSQVVQEEGVDAKTTRKKKKKKQCQDANILSTPKGEKKQLRKQRTRKRTDTRGSSQKEGVTLKESLSQKKEARRWNGRSPTQRTSQL